MAGHSLCGVEGWRKVGPRERYEEEGGGRGVKGREVGEKERRTVAWVSHGRSITRHSEVKRGGWGRGTKGGQRATASRDTRCGDVGGMGWVFFVVGACVRKAGVRWREGQVCTEGCGTTQCAKCVQHSKLIILRRLMIQLARLQNWHNVRHQWQSFPIAFIFLRLTVLTFSSRPPLFKLWNRWQHTAMYKATL